MSNKLENQQKKYDQYLKDLITNSYKSLRVVGRGTIKIDASEVHNSPEFKEAQRKTKELFKNLKK